MPKKAIELGPLAVKALTRPGLHAVGGVAGLHLQVSPSERARFFETVGEPRDRRGQRSAQVFAAYGGWPPSAKPAASPASPPPTLPSSRCGWKRAPPPRERRLQPAPSHPVPSEKPAKASAPKIPCHAAPPLPRPLVLARGGVLSPPRVDPPLKFLPLF